MTNHPAADLDPILKLGVDPVPHSASPGFDEDPNLEIPSGLPHEIRGKWLLRIDDPGQDQPKPKLLILFAGKTNSGKIEALPDPDHSASRYWLAAKGEYRVSSNLAVMKIRVGEDWYYFHGNFHSRDHISGDHSYDTGAPPRRYHGTWTATRIE